MKYISKNIIDAAIDGDIESIIHQANCQSVMGAGLAKQIKYRCPSAYDDYINDKVKKLGGYSYGVQKKCKIINIYGQYNYGRTERYTNYAALMISIFRIIKDLNLKQIGVPKGMGCNLGGGNWLTIQDILSDIEVMTGVEFVVYSYD